MQWLRVMWLGLAMGLPVAQAAQITQVNPEQNVQGLQAVVVTFNAPVAPSGNPFYASPVDIACGKVPLQGSARWLDASRWKLDLPQPFEPGHACRASVNPDFKTITGQSLSGKGAWSFASGTPSVVQSRPSRWAGGISEDQIFLLQFNVPVDSKALVAATGCHIEGIGEKVPVRLVTGADRETIIRAEFPQDTGQWLNSAAIQLLQCVHRLPAEADIRLSIEPGLKRQSGQSFDPVSQERMDLDFTVQPAFSATLLCQRENAAADCLPMTPMVVSFSAPVPGDLAAQIRLKGPQGMLAPVAPVSSASNTPVSELRFNGPFPPKSRLELTLPTPLVDESGRSLVNADRFPLAIPIADYPPLVKFASSSFGVIERFAAAPGSAEAHVPALVPVTVRHVEPDLVTQAVQVSPGTVAQHVVRSDIDVLRWMTRLQRLEQSSVTATQLNQILQDKPLTYDGQSGQPDIDTRSVSVLKGVVDIKEIPLPAPSSSQQLRPFEVIGVPLTDPGFYVLEVKSPRLGASLLASGDPMYVRTSVLVTNLSVHMKAGRDDLLAWVTALDTGKPVAGAQVTALDCNGRELAKGVTDAQGVWHVVQSFEIPDYCPQTGWSRIFISARLPADHPAAHGKEDYAFVLSDWNRGIEPWRFNIPTNTNRRPSLLTHTVLDRTLFRAGETVSMKHFVREQTRHGLVLPSDAAVRPSRVVITHQGSGDSTTLPITWASTPSGGVSAFSQFHIPATARTGVWTVQFEDENATQWYGAGSEFRVEAFTVPVLAGEVSVRAPDTSPKAALVAPQALDVDVQLAYLAGGPASGLKVDLSGVSLDRPVAFKDYDDFSFEAPPSDELSQVEGASSDASVVGPLASSSWIDEGRRVFLDRSSVTLNAQGVGSLSLSALPRVQRPAQWVFEASFFDPNGQVQTLTHTQAVWPADVQTGIRAESWAQKSTPFRFTGLALSTTGEPLKGQPIKVHAYEDREDTVRRRLVGGFYAYDSVHTVRDLGVVCEGVTNTHGELSCEYAFDVTGQVRLVAHASDTRQRQSLAQTRVWFTGDDDLWFSGGNDDRIDIVPSQKSWQPGDMAEFQVKMPYREATALVSVEREGVLSTQVVALTAKDPVIRVPVQAEWGGDAYVSVLAVRGRIYDVPWSSFFSWGWQNPGLWWQFHTRSQGGYQPPTTQVDLSKPSYRFGLAPLLIQDPAHQLIVKVQTDKQVYAPGQTVPVQVQVTLPDGTPAAGASVALVAVDQALLELSENSTWDLVLAMQLSNEYGVETATAQSQVVGRRHFGRKALPAGGGGGKSPTRELLDTLIAWQPDVVLDAQGRATIPVTLNDALTQFTIIAVADYGANRFGQGRSQIRSVRDLQLIAGLPAMVRTGDQYQAQITVRNATAHPMKVQVQADVLVNNQAVESGFQARQIDLAAGQALPLNWSVSIPADALALQWSAQTQSLPVQWTFRATQVLEPGATGDLASDALVAHQTVRPDIPVQVQQASLITLSPEQSSLSMVFEPPAGALRQAGGAVAGGVLLQAQPSLAQGLPAIRQWFEAYPYTCFEQLGSRALALENPQQWDQLMARLPDYQDKDGLVAFFPGQFQGSEVLTSYLLLVTAQAKAINSANSRFELPQAARERMLNGLLDFVEGRIERQRWAPTPDRDARVLMALAALSQYGMVQPHHLDRLTLVAPRLSTMALLDWIIVLQRVSAIPQREHRLQEALSVLRTRTVTTGTQTVLSPDPLNQSWWLMSNETTNLARLILAVRHQPEWQSDLPLLVRGLLSWQQRGVWSTTTANMWGMLALQAFDGEQADPLSGVVYWSMAPLASDSLTTQEPSNSQAPGQPQEGAWVLDSTSGVSLENTQVVLPWSGPLATDVRLVKEGTGRLWATLESHAAVPVREPVHAGIAVERFIEPIGQARPGVWTRGDTYRVHLKMTLAAASNGLVIEDPVPAGATILGSGLRRDSLLSQGQSERHDASVASPAYVDRQFDAFRAYYDDVPAGQVSVSYTVRLNTAGLFRLPATRAHLMYRPDIHGLVPNAPVSVQAIP